MVVNQLIDPLSQRRGTGRSGRATARHEHADIHPAPCGGGDDLRRNPGAAAAAPCLPLPGGEPDVVAADRLGARLFGTRGVHPRLQTVDRNNALAREKAPPTASISCARPPAVRPGGYRIRFRARRHVPRSRARSSVSAPEPGDAPPIVIIDASRVSFIGRPAAKAAISAPL